MSDERGGDNGSFRRKANLVLTGFVLIMFGFLLQWPTLLTLAMFPVLVYMYAHLARREERDALAQFGDEYAVYAKTTPRFVPKLGVFRSTATPG